MAFLLILQSAMKEVAFIDFAARYAMAFTFTDFAARYAMEDCHYVNHSIKNVFHSLTIIKYNIFKKS